MKRMRMLVVVALALVICLPGMASAYPTVDLFFVRVDNSVTTYINAPGFGSNVGVYTGNYMLSLRNPSGSGNPYTEVSGYCVEPTNESTTSKVYELLPIAEGSAFEAAAWILSQGYNGTPQSAVAQSAVWELAWDTALGIPFSLTADNYRLNSGVSATDVTTMYSNAMAQVGVGGFNPSAYVIAHNPVGSTNTWAESQDFIIRNPNPVPLPPSVLLMGTGILGLVGLGWRRSRKES